MRVIYHNWSATKQRPHRQSVAEISHHSVLSGDRIRQCEAVDKEDKAETRKIDEIMLSCIRFLNVLLEAMKKSLSTTEISSLKHALGYWDWISHEMISRKFTVLVREVLRLGHY